MKNTSKTKMILVVVGMSVAYLLAIIYAVYGAVA